jgi:hypothetical protein
MNGEPGFLVGKGRIVEADYRSVEISTYRGNPLIEALPAIWTEDEVEERLKYPSPIRRPGPPGAGTSSPSLDAEHPTVLRTASGPSGIGTAVFPHD